MRKILFFAMAFIMLVSLMSGCAPSETKVVDSKPNEETVAPQDIHQDEQPKPKEDVTVKFLNMKVEIADALKKMIPEFEKENPGILLEIETVGGGADYGAAVMAKFQSGEAPDIWNNTGFSDLDKWIEKVEDLSDQPWINDMIEGADLPISKDDKIYGLPLAVEGFGFAYNKDLFAKAGITDLPNTLSSLEEACKKLEAAGIQPFSNSYAEWWVLGLHNMNLPLAHQSDPVKFIEDVAAGNATFKGNEIMDGWLKLLDLTVKYGQKNATTAGDYATSVNAFAAGEAAMIQQGNWIQPDLDKIDPDLNIGFVPMPVSDSADNKINAGIPNYLVVNNESPVKAEAKTFLNWLVTSATGKRYVTEEMKALPAFKSIKSDSFKGLNAALLEYTSAGNTYPWVFPRLPNGSSELIGAEMMKYLGEQSTAAEMLEAIDKAIVDKAAASK